MTSRKHSRDATLTALACAIGMMVSVVPFHIGTFPLFLGPVSREFGWGRAEFAMSVNVSGIFAAIAAPLVGRMVDRFGARAVLLPAVVLYALATMAQSELSTSKLQFYLTYCVLGASEAIAGPVAFAHLISSWFQSRRGLMLALVIGAAPTVSLMIMAPVTHALIGDLGWRTTYVILGATILVLGLPAFAFLLRDPDPAALARAGRAPSSEPTALPGLTVPRVLATATFWMILMALVIHSLVVNGVRAHSVALMTDRHISALASTLALSTFAFAGLAGNVSSGFLLDRVPSPRVAVPFFAAALIGLFLINAATGASMALTGMAVLGFGIGAESGIGPYLFSRYFGMRSFGTIYGCLVSLLAIGSGLGPYLLGRAFDRFGSYDKGLELSEAGLGLGIVLILLLGRYVYAVRSPEEDEAAREAAPAAAGGGRS
ncbi:MAG TPA: MFS transporter [Steroidobacteraceae bacterium]|nr:MFS transporter [Steroidobacteraceae bacterium]